MTLKIESPEVAELFFAARQLLLNSSCSAFLKPSLDRVRAALAQFDEQDAAAFAVAAVKEKQPAAAATPAEPVSEPTVPFIAPHIAPDSAPPAKPTRKKTVKKKAAKKTIKAAKPIKKAAKKTK